LAQEWQADIFSYRQRVVGAIREFDCRCRTAVLGANHLGRCSEIAMKNAAREAGFAMLAWLVPFGISVCIFPLKLSNPPLFDTLMGVTLTASTVLLGCIYMRRMTGGCLRNGARIGVIWAVANWALDSLMFSSGPMQMTLDQYISDIGLAYLAILAITVGLGFMGSVGCHARGSALAEHRATIAQ
jgi:hypothetical protein